MGRPAVKMAVLLVLISLAQTACGPGQQSSSGLTPEEARQIAKDAFVYGFPK